MEKVPAELMKEYVNSQKFTSTTEIMEAMKAMFGDVLQQVMEAELETKLGYEKSERTSNEDESGLSKNYRNGHSKKTVKTQLGEVTINVPRDRNGEYEPSIIGKYNRNADGMEKKILSLYSCGMSQRDISEQIKNLYDVEISPELVSKISEKIMPEGIILESVIEGMAAYYSEQLSQNVKRGQRASAMKAQSTGGNRPLGYLTGPDKKFIIDPETAPTVKLIYELYAQGKTVAQIVDELNSRGLRTLRGRPFTHNSLRTVLKNEKYIGVYTYNDEIRLENAIPPIIDKETFDKVQEMLKYNQRFSAHKNPKTDYILSGKLFCGKCGEMMVGVCGTSRHGTRHYYYECCNKRKKLCNKKSVRKPWIENVVLDYIANLLKDKELLDFIAENTYQYYIEQNTETSYTKALRKALKDTEKSIANLVTAIEQGIFNEATKKRMDELEEQKSELEAALAASKLKQDLGLTKEKILYFLYRFADMDYTDLNCQKRLIKTFINSVFVYDDKIVLTFNYSGDDRIVTLKEIDGGLQHGVRMPHLMWERFFMRTDLIRKYCSETQYLMILPQKRKFTVAE